ncbi:hypothetical protein [Sodalis sp. dw_96]|uniref:hypothetical protein n=1 Tax=Sodalis sp. dw_96 TaxID=2719794 RepID=UPI001BD1DFA0|nr:hypothetical protein [Sodalis sp. dw_96]
MPDDTPKNFIEFHCGDMICHRYDFIVQGCEFLIIFSLVDIRDEDYHQYRCQEVGFNIPANSYDIKFDRLDNYISNTFYAPPLKGAGLYGLGFLHELTHRLKNIITLHYNIYATKTYFAVAENQRLKRFYHRILQRSFDDVIYEVSTDLGEGGKGYAVKTRCF